MFEMRERLEGRRHYMKYGAFLVGENLLRYLKCGLRFAPRQVQHLGFAIAMMLDQLIGSMTMVRINIAMRRQYMLDLEILNF